MQHATVSPDQVPFCLNTKRDRQAPARRNHPIGTHSANSIPDTLFCDSSSSNHVASFCDRPHQLVLGRLPTRENTLPTWPVLASGGCHSSLFGWRNAADSSSVSFQKRTGGEALIRHSSLLVRQKTHLPHPHISTFFQASQLRFLVLWASLHRTPVLAIIITFMDALGHNEQQKEKERNTVTPLPDG